jgi:uncharacterized protein (TIGR03067 family)
MNKTRLFLRGLLLGLSLLLGCQDRPASTKVDKGSVAVSAAPGAGDQGDLRKLQGLWRPKSFGYSNLSGDKLLKLFVKESPCDWLLIQDGNLKCFSGFDEKKEKYAEASFKLDPSKNPRTIDLVFDGATFQGIYELKGNEARLRIGEEVRPGQLQWEEFLAGKNEHRGTLMMGLERVE